MRGYGLFFSFLALAFVLSGGVYAQPPASQAAAERYVKELAGHLSSGDRAAYRKFAEANFAPGFLQQVPMQQHLGFYSNVRDRTRGYDVVRTRSFTATRTICVGERRRGRAEPSRSRRPRPVDSPPRVPRFREQRSAR